MPKSKAEREQRNQYGTHWVSLSAVTLTLAATPLGNPRDASQRLREAIEGAAIVAAEDSRKFHRLCADMEVEFGGRVISFFEGNESDRTEEILKLYERDAQYLSFLMPECRQLAILDFD